VSAALVAFLPPPGDFSPKAAADADAGVGVGPSSNTGQKGRGSLAAPIFDFLTVVLPAGALKKSGCRDWRQLLDWMFGTGNQVVMGAIQDRVWQFHPQSATLVDCTGEVAGKVGFAENGKVCYSLSGHACRFVPNWQSVHRALTWLQAKITRVDIAVDDLQGEAFDVRYFERAYDAGQFNTGGRNPDARFVDDKGSGKGCTLYIGQKGHKELCIYEKGKQLGDPASRHVRCELRLYAKRLDLPLDVLLRPGDYFGSAYPMLAEFVVGEATRLLVKHQMVNASAVAMLRFLRTQAGTALNLAMDAFGQDGAEQLVAFLRDRVARHGCPGRFKGVPGDLATMFREEVERRPLDVLRNDD
jgi:phage replication initiation protein